MNSLEQIVSKIYGKRLIKFKQQGNAHYLFTLYQDINCQKTYYLKTIELPTFLYISEENTKINRQKYGNLVPDFQIMPIDRNFQAYTYLVRSPYNILPLATYLQIKKDCGEPLDIDFFIRFLFFAIKSFKIVESNELPLFGIGQIGLTETGQLILSDPSFYFSGHQTATIKEQFGSWIAEFLKSALQLPLSKDLHQGTLRQYFGEYYESVQAFLEYLLSGNSTLQVTQARLNNAFNRNSQDISTVTGSSIDMNDLIERSQNEIGLVRKTKFKKIGKLAKIMIIFIIIALAGGATFFSFKFFNRTLQCKEGEFLSPSKNCQSCSNGCVRCLNQSDNMCTKCSLNMFLIVANVEDQEGTCLSYCSGRPIRVNVCVRQQAQNDMNTVISQLGT